jgi:hypothetical protein
MIEAGVIHEDEKFELIEGEIVMMAAKGVAHERIKSALMIAIARALPDTRTMGVETTLRLTDTSCSSRISRLPQGAVQQIVGWVRSARPGRSPSGHRGRRVEPRLRQGSQGAALCAPPCQRALGGGRRRMHHLGAHRRKRRRVVVNRQAGAPGSTRDGDTARLLDQARGGRVTRALFGDVAQAARASPSAAGRKERRLIGWISPTSARLRCHCGLLSRDSRRPTR